MNKKSLLTLTIVSLLITACATTKESVFTGAMIGATGGAAIGHNHSRHSTGKLNGALIGAAIGGAIGYFSHKNKLKKNSKTKIKIKSKKDKYSPLLTKPKVRMIWVPDSIKGNRYVEKHKVWILESGSSWTK